MIPNHRLSFIIISLLILLFTIPSSAYGKYHPSIMWREISNDRFIVVFPEGYQDDALYTLNTAEEVFRELSRLWNGAPPFRDKIRILLSDVYDEANGSASFFPYNHIEIYLSTPPPDSQIGSSRDTIRLEISHELSHIFTFNWGSGFSYFLRKIFGANPFLFPAIYMPIWMIEGLAVYNESKLEPGGRLNSPDFNIMLRELARSDKIPQSEKIWGDTTPWPGPTSKYLYGAAFIRFLAKKYGQDKIPEFVKTYANYPLPLTFAPDSKLRFLTVGQRFKLVFKKKLKVLWAEFIQDTRSAVSQEKTGETLLKSEPPGLKYLTNEGFFNEYPILTDDGNVYYYRRNYTEYPGIYHLQIKNGIPGPHKRLTDQSGVNALFFSEKENQLYFSASNYYKSFYLYSDLYRLNLKTQKVSRLSKGQRLSYPTKSTLPDEINKIYCVKRINSTSYLAIWDIDSKKDRIISRGFESLAFLSISPDNRFIAASIKEKGKEWTIGLFTMKGELISRISDTQNSDTLLKKCYYPSWKNAEELLFITQDKDHYRLASCKILPESQSHPVSIYEKTGDPQLPDFHHLSISPDRQKVIASLFSDKGFDLGTLELSALSHSTPSSLSLVSTGSGHLKPGEKTGTGIETQQDSLFPDRKVKSRTYLGLRDILPQYISPDYRYGGNEFQPGILLSSQDLLVRHSYLLEAFYGFKSNKFNYMFTYTYDGFYPTLLLHASDLSDYNRSEEFGNYIYNERKIKLISLFPIIRKTRYEASIFSDIHFERTHDKYASQFPSREPQHLNGIALGFIYNSAMKYYDSISNADGSRLSLSYSREWKFLGSDQDNQTLAFQYRKYISLSRPNVLALQFALADSWGKTKRIFHMGGVATTETDQYSVNDMFKRMRGFPSGFFTGTGGFLFNLEYRISLLKIEHVFLISRSVERMYLSLFTDIGNLWTGKKEFKPAYSAGMELNLILYIGDIRFNLSGGVALGQNPYHSPVLYFRMGNSF